MITFEDMFDTRFWDTKEELFFTRHTPSPLARYEANFTNKTLRKSAQVSLRLGGVTHKYVSVSRGFNRRDFLIPFFTHFLHTEGCHLKGVFTVE